MSDVAPFPCACTALRKAARAVSRFYDEALADTGLTTTQFAVLRHLSRLGDPPLSRLADALVMDRTSLYRTLQPLVREGWITIEAGKGRAKIARLTAAGRVRMEGATASWQTAQHAFLNRFGSDDWAGVSQALQRAVEIVDA